MLLFFGAMPARADEPLQLHEQEIKAGLLYNFLKYTDWPTSTLASNAPIMVCVFGDDPLEKYLAPMTGRTVNQHEIVLRKIHDIPEIKGCHLLFINVGEKPRWPQLYQSLKGKNILTVSDIAGFAAAGGMIEFGSKDNHISVDLNIDAVTAGGLHVQDRLLRLVSIMHAPQGGQQP